MAKAKVEGAKKALTSSEKQAQRISNSNWLLGLAPIIGAGAGWMVIGAMEETAGEFDLLISMVIIMIVMYALSMVFCLSDKSMLSDEGYKLEHGVLNVPGYLRARAEVLRDSRASFWAWIILYILQTIGVFA